MHRASIHKLNLLVGVHEKKEIWSWIVSQWTFVCSDIFTFKSNCLQIFSVPAAQLERYIHADNVRMNCSYVRNYRNYRGGGSGGVVTSIRQPTINNFVGKWRSRWQIACRLLFAALQQCAELKRNIIQLANRQQCKYFYMAFREQDKRNNESASHESSEYFQWKHRKCERRRERESTPKKQSVVENASASGSEHTQRWHQQAEQTINTYL